ncbi:flavin reductase (DIM6/NTAB) family NADH-FMN oxidoreductase RutF [Lysobacter niastensis]|uniref:Flavin reductase (DIM6/NTAB) family NADH-FMN oxidoreductase RutF n=1 Tax=Lysobacter niastensis TaxID=380629 RepID=A0ABU1WCC0_9GAMM|nr:flavin reductase family protein [Lysobacter niastensis]MDR7135060.1 flavin reductase (DIM6/NTAB) family NADH-FMN oxidoreductase RutF [Lysobacter niastensis]
MKIPEKHDFPLTDIRRYLEPGPIVLVSSCWKDETNIMVMGWHMMLGFSPAMFGCYIWEGNHSFELIRRSRECVINLPTADMVDTVVGIGNCSGSERIDKFAKFGLTARPGRYVDAQLIAECHANFECKLADDRQIDEYGLFIWEVVKAHVAPSPKRPETLHYRGDAEFMTSGGHISRRSKFKPQNL